MASFKLVVDNTDLVKNATDQAIERALTAAGMQCEGYAKALCPVDTGRLRNSITNQLDSGGKKVYVGTNVEYAPYVHEGHMLPSGKHVPPRRFLRDTLVDYADDYKTILELYLSNMPY